MGNSNTENIQLVKELVDAWNRLAWDEVFGMLADDVVCHNIPMEKIVGRDAVRKFYESIGETTWANWQILTIAEDGNKVLTERLDDFTINGKDVSLPVMGVFEVSDGKITAWRDYFCMKMLESQFAA